jgi:hypothetical protein
MLVVACPAPSGPLDPAPLTSLPLGIDGTANGVRAFWNADDAYFVCVTGADASAGRDQETAGQWFQLSAEQDTGAERTAAEQRAADDDRARAARQFLDVIPMGGGRVAFPIGSTGRTVYRVWRSKRTATADSAGTERPARRTRILGVRAGRSLRRPA